MHTLLLRQLKRHSVDPARAECAPFIAAVDAAYQQFDKDRALLERSLQLTSEELMRQNGELARQLSIQRAMLDAIPDRMFRLRREGAFLADDVPPHARALVAEHAIRALQSQQVQRCEFAREGESGVAYFEARLVASAPDEALMIVRDVTERIRLEEQVRASERMTSLGTLAAGVAHEINNPLTFLVANLDWLSEHLHAAPSAITPELREALADSKDGADRVRAIVRDLKAFTRPEEATLGPVDVHRCLDAAAHMASNELRFRARLVTSYGEVPRVLAIESRLGQVFINLIVNASHAIAEGNVANNQVSLSTRRAPDGRVVVEVADTGSGMPPGVLARVFDPFFTTKPVGAGTGLGLYISQQIVHSFGGEISVVSEVGRGTRFRIALRVAPPEKAASLTHTVDPGSAGARILIVDDEPALVRSLKRLLAGHVVQVAASGRVALELLSNGERFDVILCDLMMPDLTGMELHDAVSRLEPGLERRMIFMTGGAFTPAAVAFLSRFPNAVVEKPFDMLIVRKAIRDAMTSGRAR